jgi:glucose/arabinose dehydrogenase
MTGARTLFSSADPYGNHNGGMLAFGPNGRLYFTMGDGGAGGDPENRSQNPRSLFGKLLSINVATKGLRIEAYGLRNAWRFSFDRANGDLYIGDVGQGAIEEINYVPARSSAIENYGWDVYEGRSSYERKALGPGKLVQPVAQYTHANGCSVTGGYVYRGANPALRGRYIYGDYCSANIWSFEIAGGRATGLRREPFQIESVTSFGEDIAGELYAVSHDGVIYRLTP